MQRSDFSPASVHDDNLTTFMPNLEHPFITLFCGNCHHRLVVPVYCKNRFCPVCSKRRVKIVRHRISSLLDRLQLKGRERLVMVTLTIRSMKDPSDMMDHLVAAFRRLRNRVIWKRRVRGGFYVIEITRNDNMYHLHIHSICAADYIPWRKLSQQWESVSGSPGIHIKQTTKSKAIHYLTKYLTKPSSDIPIDKLNAALKDRRLFQCFGTFQKLLKPYAPPQYQCPCCHAADWFSCAELGSYNYSKRGRPPPPN